MNVSMIHVSAFVYTNKDKFYFGFLLYVYEEEIFTTASFLKLWKIYFNNFSSVCDYYILFIRSFVYVYDIDEEIIIRSYDRSFSLFTGDIILIINWRFYLITVYRVRIRGCIRYQVRVYARTYDNILHS